MDDKLTAGLKKTGLRSGADNVGVASAEELQNIDSGADAGMFLSGATSVVVALVSDPPGIVDTRNGAEYAAMAFPGYQRADGAVKAMRGFIERSGFKTHYIIREWHKARDRRGRGADTLPLKPAAVAAGLGSVGLHTLLVTPDFGPRVRLSGFVTDAPLTADAPFDQRLCDDCGVCERECPSGAIGAKFPVNIAACSAYLFAGLSAKQIKTALSSGDPAALRENAERLGDSIRGWTAAAREGKRLYYNCGRCVQVCNAHIRAKRKKK